jgi:hypothetical protein
VRTRSKIWPKARAIAAKPILVSRIIPRPRIMRADSSPTK